MSPDHVIRRALPSLMAIRAFESAARHGNFTLAASELFLTQSAISRHVRNLEESLGVKLFRRNGRRLTLTPEGRDYMDTMSDAFDRMAAATARLRRPARRNVLTVSMLPSFALKWFTPRLSKFIVEYPTIDIRISASGRSVDFDREGDDIDVAIRYGRGGWPGADAEELASEEIFPICSPRLLEGPPRLENPRDLERVTLLHGSLRENWETWLKAAGYSDIDAGRGPSFNEASALIQAAVDGLGVALGRSLLVLNDLRDKRLVVPFGPRLVADFSYWLVTPRGRDPHPCLPKLREWLRAQIAQDRQDESRSSTALPKTRFAN